ncbi:adenosylcobinamide amidohydrolase [Paenibacillus sp. D2_2]|uniref:adenosylcobinamide amidohydrolase n=1 Tax=Paenibacillus sp. D2_2 TaxID=3073092 RepID=UPI0028162773|nr:adenosylcobinamide amidohydrolase [Paenibacillus sp. D2_2]WMT39907.1 adenosylcobinamide amidohydrolase [Paenibacillus sp. D2_2]
MTMPFIDGAEKGLYESEAWAGLKLLRSERHLLLTPPTPLQGVSSAVYGGGMRKLHQIVNIYVDKHYRCDEPESDIRRLLQEWDISEQETAGLLTAVRLRYAAVAEERCNDYAVFCCATAGASNSARAGVQRTTFPAVWTPGRSTSCWWWTAG